MITNTMIQPTQIKLGNGDVIEFGKTVKTKEYFRFETDNPNLSNNLRKIFFASGMATKPDSLDFVSPEYILRLCAGDAESFMDAADNFYAQLDKPHFVSENIIKLGYGLEIDGISYDLLVLGRTANLFDSIEATSKGLTVSETLAFLAFKEITEIKQSNGSAALRGQIKFEDILNLNFIDGLNFAHLANQENAKTAIQYFYCKSDKLNSN